VLRSAGNFGRVVDRPRVQFREVSVTIGRDQALAKSFTKLFEPRKKDKCNTFVVHGMRY
jgi:hypothetical protein